MVDLRALSIAAAVLVIPYLLSLVVVGYRDDVLCAFIPSLFVLLSIVFASEGQVS